MVLDAQHSVVVTTCPFSSLNSPAAVVRARCRRLSVTASTFTGVNAGVTSMRPILRAGLVERGSTSMTIGPDANVLCDSEGEEDLVASRHW